MGGWIAPRLGAFGPSVGHAVPLGYDAYAVVPIVPHEDGEPEETLSSLDPVLASLADFTGGQPVHTGIWEGWGWFYPTGTVPRATGVGVCWDGPRPSPQERERVRAQARADVARDMVEIPDLAPLDLPNRRYYVWTGPLRSVTAFREWLHDPPSLIWPRDRSWFVGIPIYSAEIAIAGSQAAIEAIAAVPDLNARLVDVDYELEIDD